MSSDQLTAPFPYIGGKSSVASMVWDYFGDVRTYIEPFGGSLAVLLGRPEEHFKNNTRIPREIANDFSGLVVNAWRAISYDPEGLSTFILDNCPVFEVDLHSRQLFLKDREEDLMAELKEDPEQYDLKSAAYWISGLSAHVTGANYPSQISNQRPRIAAYGKGVHSPRRLKQIRQLINDLALRLRHVKILCGDWSRCVTEPAMEADQGEVGVFLDPPYTKESGRQSDLYDHDDLSVGREVYEWCMKYGENPSNHPEIGSNIKIALCGLEGEYDMPDSWTSEPWSAQGSSQNASRERIWFSPNCVQIKEVDSHLTVDELFDLP